MTDERVLELNRAGLLADVLGFETDEVARSTDGTAVITVGGREFVDFTGGIAVHACGHCHPEIVKAASGTGREGSAHVGCPAPRPAAGTCVLFARKISRRRGSRRRVRVHELRLREQRRRGEVSPQSDRAHETRGFYGCVPRTNHALLGALPLEVRALGLFGAVPPALAGERSSRARTTLQGVHPNLAGLLQRRAGEDIHRQPRPDRRRVLRGAAGRGRVFSAHGRVAEKGSASFAIHMARCSSPTKSRRGLGGRGGSGRSSGSAWFPTSSCSEKRSAAGFRWRASRQAGISPRKVGSRRARHDVRRQPAFRARRGWRP